MGLWGLAVSSADPLTLIPCCPWALWPPRVKSPKWAQAVAPQRTSGPAAHQFWEPEHRQTVEAATPKWGCQEGPAGWLGSRGSRRKPFPRLTGYRCPARQDSSPQAPPLLGEVRGASDQPTSFSFRSFQTTHTAQNKYMFKL